MHFSHAVAAIQSLVGTIKDVHILYCEKDALGVDLVINMTGDGIKLAFDPVNQRLKVIEVHDLALIRLKYRYGVRLLSPFHLRRCNIAVIDEGSCATLDSQTKKNQFFFSQRHPVQLSGSGAHDRADRPDFWGDSPGRLRRGEARVHAHLQGTRVRVSGRYPVSGKCPMSILDSPVQGRFVEYIQNVPVQCYTHLGG